jgi:hypothetical protein
METLEEDCMRLDAYEMLQEAVKLLDEWNKENATESFFTLECTPAGLRMKATYQKGMKHYTQENLTPWTALRRAGLQANPLAPAFEALLTAVANHQAASDG